MSALQEKVWRQSLVKRNDELVRELSKVREENRKLKILIRGVYVREHSRSSKSTQTDERSQPETSYPDIFSENEIENDENKDITVTGYFTETPKRRSPLKELSIKASFLEQDDAKHRVHMKFVKGMGFDLDLDSSNIENTPNAKLSHSQSIKSNMKIQGRWSSLMTAVRLSMSPEISSEQSVDRDAVVNETKSHNGFNNESTNLVASSKTNKNLSEIKSNEYIDDFSRIPNQMEVQSPVPVRARRSILTPISYREPNLITKVRKGHEFFSKK